MLNESGYAQYSFLVQVCTNEHNIVNNFGYQIEDKFQEDITREIMKSLAAFPNLIMISVDPVVGVSEEMFSNVNEEVDEEE